MKRLVFEINSKVGIIGRLSEVQRGAIDETTHQLSDLAEYAVSFVAVRDFIEDLGLFVKDRLAAMDSGNRDILLQLSAATILGLVDYIRSAVVDRNDYIDAAPSVIPHHLVHILPHDFCVLTTPSTSKRLIISGASTRPCVMRTTANLN